MDAVCCNPTLNVSTICAISEQNNNLVSFTSLICCRIGWNYVQQQQQCMFNYHFYTDILMNV